MANTPYQARQLGDSSLRNLILNGAFDFWQRATSATGVTTSGYKAADRFRHFTSGTTSVDIDRSADAPTFAQSGFSSSYSLRYKNNTILTPAAGDVVRIHHRVEGYNYAAVHGRSVRLQFWVKSSLAGAYSVGFRNSATDRTYVTTYSISQADTWEKKTIDLRLDTAGTWLFDNGIGLDISWTLACGSSGQTSTLNQWQSSSAAAANTQVNWASSSTNRFFYLAQVSLIPGKFDSASSTGFVRAERSITSELAACQRYYEKNLPISVIPADDAAGVSDATSTLFNVLTASDIRGQTAYFKATKRTTPTMSFYRPSNTASAGSWTYQTGATVAAFDSITSNYVNEVSFSARAAKTTLTTAGTIVVGYGYWTADAEL